MLTHIRRSLGNYLDRHPTARRIVALCQKRRVASVIFIWMFAHILGALTSIRAIMEVRTPQGTIAWVTALNATPFISVPAYWILGRSKFQGYVLTRKNDLAETNETAKRYLNDLTARGLLVTNSPGQTLLVEKLANWRFTAGNDADLLIDGEAVFKSIFAGIDKATNYILVEYYFSRRRDRAR